MKYSFLDNPHSFLFAKWVDGVELNKRPNKHVEIIAHYFMVSNVS